VEEEANRGKVRELIKDIFNSRIEEPFIEGKTKIRYAGAVYDHEEINLIVDAALNGWFGLAKYARLFEAGLTDFMGSKETILTNSGSSASLLAVSSLTSKELSNPLKKRR